jgi:TDG/mug DNA glycosylase family protein
VSAAGPRPSPAEVAAAHGRPVPDLIAPGLDVLFCGINPSLYSAAVGHHFARPGNRFWKALHLSGFTPRLLAPHEGGELLGHGLGVTNVWGRATATAAEVSDAELRAGAVELVAKLEANRPAWVAFLGIGAYRVAFGAPRAAVGPRPQPVGGARTWVLPNPSGLNAHYQLPDLAAAFAELRRATPSAQRVAEVASTGPSAWSSCSTWSSTGPPELSSGAGCPAPLDGQVASGPNSR